MELVRTFLRRFGAQKLNKKELKEALKVGPKFSDFVTEPTLTENSRGDGRLPQWLKTPIAVGERYSHLKETLRDLKLHTVRRKHFSSVCRNAILSLGMRGSEMPEYWRLLERGRRWEGYSYDYGTI